MDFIRIAQAQINTRVGDFVGNICKIVEYIKMSKDAGADIVTFPELTISGYPPEDLLLKPHFLRDSRKALNSVIDETDGITIVVGFPDFDENGVYNAAALIHNKEITSFYHKIELPNYGVFDEKRYFVSGDKPLIFTLSERRIMLTICEDIWIEKNSVVGFASENDIDIVLNISASPFHAKKLFVRRGIVSNFAKNTNSYVCYNNLVGGQDELVFDGTSLVVSNKGELIASAERFKEDLLITDLDYKRDNIKKTGSKISTIVLESKRVEEREKKEPKIASEMENIEEIYHALILGTRDYIKKNGFNKVVIGLSGGIDSSLTAAIAVYALGSENVIGVTMPSQYTSIETLSDAELTAKNLGIEIITVPIKPIFVSYLEHLKDHFGGGDLGVEAENLQARIRGNILMALSNRFGWIVLTTGNKSEMSVGYATLYGDMAGGFAMIKDVPKTIVYKISEYINEIEGRDIIPKSIIERPPTAELRPDQKDEDSLPPYDILDPILSAYVENDKDPEDIAKEGYDINTVLDVIRMVDLNEYKRRQAPPGIKITPKAFGRDRRLPITNRYLRDRLINKDS